MTVGTPDLSAYEPDAEREAVNRDNAGDRKRQRNKPGHETASKQMKDKRDSWIKEDLLWRK